MVSLHVTGKHFLVTKHLSKIIFWLLPLCTYLHFHAVFIIPLWRTSPKIGVLSRNCKKRGKTCWLKPLYQEESGRDDNRWNGELHNWSSKPREMQMTGETSPCQQQPTLLWPTALSDGWICAGMVHEQGPLGERGGEAGQSALKPYVQKHIPKHFFQKLLSNCPQRTAGVWNAAEFILDSPTLIVVV